MKPKSKYLYPTCPPLHRHRAAHVPAPGCHGDVVPPSRCEHVEGALPHVWLHLSGVHGDVVCELQEVMIIITINHLNFEGNKRRRSVIPCPMVRK